MSGISGHLVRERELAEGYFYAAVATALITTVALAALSFGPRVPLGSVGYSAPLLMKGSIAFFGITTIALIALGMRGKERALPDLDALADDVARFNIDPNEKEAIQRGIDNISSQIATTGDRWATLTDDSFDYGRLMDQEVLPFFDTSNHSTFERYIEIITRYAEIRELIFPLFERNQDQIGRILQTLPVEHQNYLSPHHLMQIRREPGNMLRNLNEYHSLVRECRHFFQQSDFQTERDALTAIQNEINHPRSDNRQALFTRVVSLQLWVLTALDRQAAVIPAMIAALQAMRDTPLVSNV